MRKLQRQHDTDLNDLNVQNTNCMKRVLDYHRTAVERKKDEKQIIERKIVVLEKKIIEAEEAVKAKDGLISKLENDKKDEEEEEEGTLEWGLFAVKFMLEAGLASLESLATRERKKYQVAAVIIVFVALILNMIEVVSIYRILWLVNRKIQWERIRWIPEVYGFFAIFAEFVLYLCKFRILHPVHINMYTCLFHSCLLAKKLRNLFTKKAKGGERGREKHEEFSCSEAFSSSVMVDLLFPFLVT